MPKNQPTTRDRALNAYTELDSHLRHKDHSEQIGILLALTFSLANECGWNNEKLAELFERYAERHR